MWLRNSTDGRGSSRDVQIDVSVNVEDEEDFDVTNTSAPSAKVRRKF